MFPTGDIYWISWSSFTWSERSPHPPERVFDWLVDPANLTAAPLVLRAGWGKGSSDHPGVGALREGMAVGMWFREEITAYDAPRSFSYRIVRSFPANDHEGGTLTFTPSGDGTHVGWVNSYTHPARAGGKVIGRRHLPPVPVELPRDPGWLREGSRELVGADSEERFS